MINELSSHIGNHQIGCYSQSHSTDVPSWLELEVLLMSSCQKYFQSYIFRISNNALVASCQANYKIERCWNNQHLTNGADWLWTNEKLHSRNCICTGIIVGLVLHFNARCSWLCFEPRNDCWKCCNPSFLATLNFACSKNMHFFEGDQNMLSDGLEQRKKNKLFTPCAQCAIRLDDALSAPQFLIISAAYSWGKHSKIMTLLPTYYLPLLQPLNFQCCRRPFISLSLRQLEQFHSLTNCSHNLLTQQFNQFYHLFYLLQGQFAMAN